MKKILIISIFLSSIGFAQAVRSAKTSSLDYNLILDYKNLVSAVNFFQEKSTFHNLNEVEFSRDENRLLLQIEAFKKFPVLKGDSEILLNLYLELFKLSKNFKYQKSAFSIVQFNESFKEYYLEKYFKNMAQEETNYLNNEKVTRLLELSSKEESHIYVNGFKLDKTNVQKIIDEDHFWFYISNYQRPFHFYGSASQFFEKYEQTSSFDEPCGKPVVPIENSTIKFLVISNQEDCKTMNNFDSIATGSLKKTEEKNNWLLPLTIGSGILLLSSLSDKKIVLKFPALSK